MLISISSLKGGVGKTSIAVHIAAYLQTKAPTVLVDYDPNQSALSWSEAGKLSFQVIRPHALKRIAAQAAHIVSDTEASLERKDLKDLVEGSDILIIPTCPDIMSIQSLLLMVEALKDIGAKNYKALLSIVPPAPNRAGDEARETLTQLNIPMFNGFIRRYAAHGKAALHSTTVDKIVDPHAQDAWNDYVAIGKEILK